MGLLRRARSVARRVGIDVSRYNSALDWNRQFVKQLQSHHVDVVLDIGANSGQYAADLRWHAYQGRIVSFEPLAGPFSILQSRASSDPGWDCQRCALGDSDGTVTINVAGNGGESSSVLPMLQSHRDAFPAANYIGTEQVPIRRLDSLAPEILGPTEQAFIKIDVQGYEETVLAGGKSTLAERCVGMQLELSLQALYEGSILIRDAFDLAYSMGFTLTGLMPIVADPGNGRLLQTDGIFFRNGM